jgi:hypothetical protein
MKMFQAQNEAMLRMQSEVKYLKDFAVTQKKDKKVRSA